MGYGKIYRPLVGDNNQVVVGQIATDPANGQYKTTVITAAQILAMFATPVSLLPAPGAGKAYIVDDVFVEFLAGGTQFTGGGAVEAVYHGTSTVVHSGTVPATVIQSASSSNTQLGGPSAANGTTVPANTGIDLTNLTGAFAAGNGTMKVTVSYLLITL